jgi:hypothetical protein
MKQPPIGGSLPTLKKSSAQSCKNTTVQARIVLSQRLKCCWNLKVEVLRQMVKIGKGMLSTIIPQTVSSHPFTVMRFRQYSPGMAFTNDA